MRNTEKLTISTSYGSAVSNIEQNTDDVTALTRRRHDDSYYATAELSNKIFLLIDRIKDIEDARYPPGYLQELRQKLLDDYERFDKEVFESAIKIAGRHHIQNGWTERLARQVLERSISEARKEREKEEVLKNKDAGTSDKSS